MTVILTPSKYSLVLCIPFIHISLFCSPSRDEHFNMFHVHLFYYMCVIYDTCLFIISFLESCLLVLPRPWPKPGTHECPYASFIWSLGFLNSPTTPQHATQEAWGLTSQRANYHSQPWIEVEWFPCEGFWPTETGDEINKFPLYSNLLLTFLKHYSIESVQKYLTWPSMCTGHRRDKLHLFVALHKAVATAVTITLL